MSDLEGSKTSITKPDYYRSGDLECFDILRYLDGDAFSVMNAIKYVFRAGLKGSEADDLRKAVTCLEDGLQTSEKPFADKQTVYDSDLPLWKKMIIAELMELILSEYGVDGLYRHVIMRLRERIGECESDSNRAVSEFRYLRRKG